MVSVAEQIGDRLRNVGADQPIVVPMADARMLQAIEIAQKRLPFRHNASLVRPVFQALLHGERGERTKYMAPYRGVGGMEDRPRPHHRLGSQEQVFDLEQVANRKDREAIVTALDAQLKRGDKALVGNSAYRAICARPRMDRPSRSTPAS